MSDDDLDLKILEVKKELAELDVQMKERELKWFVFNSAVSGLALLGKAVFWGVIAYYLWGKL